MARLIIVVLLLVNAALAAWLWHDLNRPEPDFASRERNAEAVRVMAVVPPSEGAARAARRQGQADALARANCVALTGLASEERPGVRDAIAGLALGERVREIDTSATTGSFVFRNPDATLLGWLGRLQRGLDAARLEEVDCAQGAPGPATTAGTSPAPVAPFAPPGGRR